MNNSAFSKEPDIGNTAAADEQKISFEAPKLSLQSKRDTVVSGGS